MKSSLNIDSSCDFFIISLKCFVKMLLSEEGELEFGTNDLEIILITRSY